METILSDDLLQCQPQCSKVVLIILLLFKAGNRSMELIYS